MTPTTLTPAPAYAVSATHASRAHSTISPSKLKSLEISPAYESDPTDPEHPITAEGTLCHEALDKGSDDMLTTDEQREWVAMCRSFVAEVIPGGKEFREVRLDILDGIWGFADLIKVAGKRAALLDYKFGWNPQEDVETNPAAQAYVFGMFRWMPDLEEIFVAYLYPRIGQVSTHTYRREDLPRIETRVRLIVEKARDARPETCRWSAETCRFCQHRFECPTLRREVLPIAQRYADTHSIPLPSFDDLNAESDPEKFAKLLEVAPVLEAVADSIKRNAVRLRITEGIEIPGWEMKTRAGRKTVLNTVLAADVFRKEGLTTEQILRACEVRTTTLGDVLGEIAPRGGKKKLLERVLDQLRDAGLLEVKEDSTFMTRTKPVPE